MLIELEQIRKEIGFVEYCLKENKQILDLAKKYGGKIEKWHT